MSEDLKEARAATERVLELVVQAERRLMNAGDRLTQASKDSDDPTELLYQLKRISIPGAVDLVEAAARLNAAVYHAERAVLEAASADRPEYDRSKVLADEVSGG